MPRVCDSLYAEVEFSLEWTSTDARHQDNIYAYKVNFWRDVFPKGLREAMEGLEPGQSATVALAANTHVPGRDPRLVRPLPISAFDRLTLAGRPLSPRLGRYYPRGRVRGLPGVFDQADAAPCRVVAVAGEEVTVDANHPLAGRDLGVTATVLSLRPKVSELGGTLNDWMENMAGFGPGMQARLAAAETDFGGPGAMDRPDQTPDTGFYSVTRMTSHLDACALGVLESLYAQRLAPGMRVLDLMASLDSHLPDGQDLEVTGLGLNAPELAANPRLHSRILRDLNQHPALPFADASFEAVLVSLSVEYLTDPKAVLAEAARVLAPGGRLLVSFSDRYFPTKAVRVWTELHDFERMGMVLGLMRSTGRLGGLATQSVRYRPRPASDPYAKAMPFSDPVYLVEGVRAD